MKILQVHTRYRQPGGEDTVVDAESRMLAAAGHQVQRLEARNPAGPLAAIPMAVSPWNPGAVVRARAAVRDWMPDVAHVHNTWFALSPSVIVALERSNVPVVCTLHNYRRTCLNATLFRDGAPCADCVGRPPWEGVRHGCYRSSRAASAAVAVGIFLQQRLGIPDTSVRLFVVLNEYMRDVLVAGGLPPDRVVVRGNSTPDPGPRTSPPGESDYVLVVGRVDTVKGTDVVIDAWQATRPRGLELLILGDGPLRDGLEQRRVPGVRFLGSQDPARVRRLLLGARALLLPSVWPEGQPMSVLEALAAGLPVMSSRIGGMPALLRELGRDWLVEPGSTQAWSAALDRLGQMPPVVLASAGAASRRTWERGHSESVALRSLESVYERAIA